MNTARNLWSILDASQRRGAMALGLAMVIGMLLETLSVGAVIPALSFLSTSADGGHAPWIARALKYLGNPSEPELIAGGLFALLGIYTIKNLFLVGLAWQQSTFLASLLEKTSDRLFGIYMSQPWTFHLQRNSAQLIRNNTTEITMFVNGCSNALLMCTELLVCAGLAAMLIYLEPIAAIVVGIVVGVATYALQSVTSHRISRWAKTRQQYEKKRIQDLQQGLGGAKDVKLLGREDEFLAEYRHATRHVAHAYQRQNFTQSLPRLWYELLATTGLVMLGLALLGQGVSGRAMIPRLGLFAAAAFRLLPSLNRIIASWQSVQFMAPVAATLSDELSLRGIALDRATRECAPFQNSISLRGVSFIYPNARSPAISDVSLSIAKGSSVGIIGGSGAGKSTLVDVLLGLLTPDTGIVAVDGVDIQSHLREWQNNLGYVPQSIFLTDDTIRRNVAFGVPEKEIDDEAVGRALQAAQMDRFVASLPSGVHTLVGERGVRLSGGQRQRIGIARALYIDPPILVLDEATSSLDINTETDVMSAVNQLHGEKTLIIVAHRLSTVANCDQLIRLENGRVVEFGTHADVIK